MGTGLLLISGGKEQLVLRWEDGVFPIQMPQNLGKKHHQHMTKKLA